MSDEDPSKRLQEFMQSLRGSPAPDKDESPTPLVSEVPEAAPAELRAVPPATPEPPMPPDLKQLSQAEPSPAATSDGMKEFLMRRVEELEKGMREERERAAAAEARAAQQQANRGEVEDQLRRISETLRRDGETSHARGRIEALEQRLDDMHKRWAGMIQEALSKGPSGSPAGRSSHDLMALFKWIQASYQGIGQVKADTAQIKAEAERLRAENEALKAEISKLAQRPADPAQEGLLLELRESLSRVNEGIASLGQGIAALSQNAALQSETRTREMHGLACAIRTLIGNFAQALRYIEKEKRRSEDGLVAASQEMGRIAQALSARLSRAAKGETGPSPDGPTDDLFAGAHELARKLDEIAEQERSSREGQRPPQNPGATA